MEELDASPNREPPQQEMSRPPLATLRQQASELLEAQRQQFDQVEAELAAYLTAMEQRIAAGAGDAEALAAAQQTRADLNQFAERLREQGEGLTRQRAELSTDRAEIASLHADLDLAREQLARERQQLNDQQRQEREQLERRAADLQHLEMKLKQAQNDLQAAQDEHQSQARLFVGRRERIDTLQLRLETELEELESRREETRAQRRRIAQQLRLERAALIQERELIQSEIDRQRKLFQKEVGREQTQLNKDRETFEQETDRIRQQLRRDRQQMDADVAAQDKARQQWDEIRRTAESDRTDQTASLLAAQHEIQQLKSLVTKAQGAAADAAEKLARLQLEHESLRLAFAGQGHNEEDAARHTAELQRERDSLLGRIQQLEAQLAGAGGDDSAADTQRMEELQRRFEMAVDDVRQLKRRNAELEEELADYQAAAATQKVKVPGDEPVTYDWETTKKRLLAELDSDAGQPAGERLTEDDRLSVEGTIRITDEMIAQRDQEIAELKRSLAESRDQPAAASQPTEHSTAEAQILDQDAVIREERERLAALEKEWQEKLRAAEVELSVQRARIARERSNLEEQQRILAAEKAAMANQPRPGQPSAAIPPKKPGHRWLSRLGLKENEAE